MRKEKSQKLYSHNLWATTDDKYNYIKPLLKKFTDNIILYIGTNNTVNDPFKEVLGKLLDLKKFINKPLMGSNVVISNLIIQNDNDKASVAVVKTKEDLHGLQLDIIDNGNITSNELTFCQKRGSLTSPPSLQ